MLRHFKRCFANQAANREASRALLKHYQVHGHYLASNINPLGKISGATAQTPTHSVIHKSPLSESTLEMVNESIRDSSPELVSFLRKTYAENVCVEFEHVVEEQEKAWLYQEYEKFMSEELEVTNQEKIKALQLLLRVEELEHFIQKKYATHKRYSGEGSESLVVALNALIAEASTPSAELGDQGVDNVVLGIPHRGRMGALVVLNDFPMRNLLHKIAGNNEISEDIAGRIDDIPTHIAVSNTKKFSTGTNSAKSDRKRVTLTMIHNPSHLESQNAISMGKTRAKLNDVRESDDTRQVLNIQVHGDAAFSGQGAAYESLTLCNLPKFTIGGSIHVITNNQIGFTT